MTDETTETETTEIADETESNPNAEAAKYRRQLRDVEAERDALRDRLTQTRRSVVEGMSGLYKPQALWLAGVDVHELFDDEGHADRDKIKAAVDEASASLGLNRRVAPDPSVGKSNGGKPSRTIVDAFRRE